MISIKVGSMHLEDVDKLYEILKQNADALCAENYCVCEACEHVQLCRDFNSAIRHLRKVLDSPAQYKVRHCTK